MGILSNEEQFIGIMQELYPDSLCLANPFVSTEAVGFAKCIGKVLEVSDEAITAYCDGLIHTAYAGLLDDTSEDEWTEIDPEISKELGYFKRVIDDAQSHGFEIKVDNGRFYFRECI